jgi:hypothetical protein
MRAGALAAWALAAALCGAEASAQQAAATPAGETVAAARGHIAEGMRRFAAMDWSGAIREFELANAAVPSPELWYNIARARERLADYAGAVEDYRRYLRDKVDPPDRAEVEARIGELQRLVESQRTASLRRGTGSSLAVRVEGELPAARVLIDGVAAENPSVPRAVAAGEHTVTVTADAFQRWDARVEVREGEGAQVFARPLRATRFRTTSPPHIASLVIGGLGLATLGASAYFGVRALTDDCGRCPAQVSAASASDVLLGVGAGLALGAVIAYFVERGASRTEVVR